MDRRSKQSIVTRTSLIGGVVGGLIHGGVAVVLWNAWFENLSEMYMLKPQNAVYYLFGMFLLGFVPVVFLVGQKVRSPAIVVGALLLLSGLASWLAGPVTAPSANPTAFGLYVLLWPGIVALASLTGVWEYRRSHRASG